MVVGWARVVTERKKKRPVDFHKSTANAFVPEARLLLAGGGDTEQQKSRERNGSAYGRLSKRLRNLFASRRTPYIAWKTT